VLIVVVGGDDLKTTALALVDGPSLLVTDEIGSEAVRSSFVGGVLEVDMKLAGFTLLASSGFFSSSASSIEYLAWDQIFKKLD